MKKKKNPVKMIRTNTRVWPDQFDFIRSESKRLNLTEGEITRRIIEYYMVKNPTITNI